LLVVLALMSALTLARTSTASAHQLVTHATSDAQQCAEPYPAQRDPSNPLDLPVAPGSDPLDGARFFVPGPAHGSAAGAIAQSLGLNPEKLPERRVVGELLAASFTDGPLAARCGQHRRTRPRGRRALQDRQPA
jgi:hypothetical protein